MTEATTDSRLISLEVKISELNKKLTNSCETIEECVEHDKELLEKLTLRVNNLDQFISNPPPPPAPDKSEIYAALAKAQQEIQNAEQNVESGQFDKRYADLASCFDAVRGPLSANDIALFQITEDPGEGMLGIRTVLAHSSGQTITDVIRMQPEKFTPQGVGSCRTYMRRYSLLGICGIAGAQDDDAEAATAGPEDYERITAQEAEAILVKADELFGERADAALAKMLDRLFGGITRVGDIKAGEAQVAVTNLENAAQLMAATAQQKDDEAKKLAKAEKAAKAEADENNPKPSREPGEEG